MRTAALTLVTLVGLSAIARAHVVSDREIQTVLRLPAGFVAKELATARPGPTGLVAPNRDGAWMAISCQRAATLLLIDAAARADTAAAEHAWSAIEAGFAQQLPAGDFRRGAAAPAADSLLENVAWVGGVARACIAVMNSPLQERFRFRWSLLRPKLQRSLDYLELRSGALLTAADSSGGALMVTAAAFLLADGTYHEPRYGRVGQAALAAALATQQPDGLLASSGRVRPLEHALGLEALQSVVMYFPSPTLSDASARAARWLEHHAGEATKAANALARGAQPRNGWSAISRGEVAFVLRYAKIPLPPPLGGAGHDAAE